MANVSQEAWDALVADVKDIRTQLRGPDDQGWAQLGQNDAGQNLSVVDGLASVKHTVEGGEPPLSHQTEVEDSLPTDTRS